MVSERTGAGGGGILSRPESSVQTSQMRTGMNLTFAGRERMT